MKNLKMILSLIFLMVFSLSSNDLFAQGQEKLKEKMEKAKKGKIDAEVTDAEIKTQEAIGKANAKGKEVKEKMQEKKAELQSDQATDSPDGNDKKEEKADDEDEGAVRARKFADAKPEEARSRLKAQQGMAKAKINLGKEKSTAAKEKIADAKAKLAKQVKEGKISEEDASEKDLAIKKVEKILDDLESIIQKMDAQLSE
jgi:hypothetical protein